MVSFNLKITTYILLSILAGTVPSNIFAKNNKIIKADGKDISIEFDGLLRSRVISRINGHVKILGKFTRSEYLSANGHDIKEFKLRGFKCSDLEDSIGQGKQYEITSYSPKILKLLIIKSYNIFPSMLFVQVRYTNTSKSSINIDGWTNNDYKFTSVLSRDTKPLFWAYLPGSYGWANDWIQPLYKGFTRKNYLGMNWVDYGGGTPVLDIWRRDAGIAIGHVERVPKIVSFPVSVETNNFMCMSLNYSNPFVLKPGESFETFKTFVSVHEGDCFRSLNEYRKFMVKQGTEFRDPPEGAYEPIWCGWGYEKDFTLQEFCGTFPEIKKVGLKWIVLDYGWASDVGDYILDKKKFPHGDTSIRALVDSIHSTGTKAKLWWNPLAVSPATEMFRKHPEYLLQNKDGSPVYIQFWNSFFLCPAYSEVQKNAKDFVTKALKVWGFDGLKIDGNNLNTVPACYNPEHHHNTAEQSLESLPDFYNIIYRTVLSINPEAVVEICPCGTNYSFYILPYMNQSVASDPQNSRQIRSKGKVLRALTGSKTVFYGDHVELSDSGEDFASTVGIGAVPGTKFTWPEGRYKNSNGDIDLTTAKEQKWIKWINIYNENMLSKGLYRGELYDIGFDRPETHVIQKTDTMYFSFYDSSYSGPVELRGLKNISYNIIDYVNNKYIEKVSGPAVKLNVSFKNYMLIKAAPI
jgi:alpha-galactosidase